MLVLTRRLGEKLIVGEEGTVLTEPVTVQILGISGSQVRLGIAAQLNVSIDRSEIREKKDAGLPAPKRVPA